jgi:2-phospho-L-lactate guanylyltransferase (CobY/MobA/RfbA family)
MNLRAVSAIVPVKDTNDAKRRLAGVLSATQR